MRHVYIMPKPRRWSAQGGGGVYVTRKTNLTWHLPPPPDPEQYELLAGKLARLALEEAGPEIPAEHALIGRDEALGSVSSESSADSDRNSDSEANAIQLKPLDRLGRCSYKGSFPVEDYLPGSNTPGERNQIWYLHVDARGKLHDRRRWANEFRLGRIPYEFQQIGCERNHLLTTENPERVPRSREAARFVATAGRFPGTYYFRVENVQFSHDGIGYRCGQCRLDGYGHQQIAHHQQHAHMRVVVDRSNEFFSSRFQHTYFNSKALHYTILIHINVKANGEEELECPLCGWTTTSTEAVAKAHVRRQHTKSVPASVVGTITSQYAQAAKAERACHAHIARRAARTGAAKLKPTCDLVDQVEVPLGKARCNS